MRARQSEGVDWSEMDLRYLLRDEYEARFARWLEEAVTLPSVEAAMRLGSSSGRKGAGERGGERGGDVRVFYRDKAQLISMCKALGLMEDLKAGVPRTAYHGVILLRIGGRRVFLAPAYKVDQDITVKVA